MIDPKVIGILLVKDEDIYIENVVLNILDFCDQIFIAENYSHDKTFDILNKLARKHSKITLSRVSHPKESHELIEKYTGTNTWVFGVDGDEIYDPSGLNEMKKVLCSGFFSEYWCIYGNVLNCVSIEQSTGIAKGYLAPPSRSMTKLYNFSLVESWTDCPQRLHSGILQFKGTKTEPPRHRLYKTMSWEQSYFRCLHTAFMPRSSRDNPSAKNSRPNPSEIKSLQSSWKRKSYFKYISKHIKLKTGKNWKHRHYQKGPLLTKNIKMFIIPLNQQ